MTLHIGPLPLRLLYSRFNNNNNNTRTRLVLEVANESQRTLLRVFEMLAFFAFSVFVLIGGGFHSYCMTNEGLCPSPHMVSFFYVPVLWNSKSFPPKHLPPTNLQPTAVPRLFSFSIFGNSSWSCGHFEHALSINCVFPLLLVDVFCLDEIVPTFCAGWQHEKYPSQNTCHNENDRFTTQLDVRMFSAFGTTLRPFRIFCFFLGRGWGFVRSNYLL